MIQHRGPTFTKLDESSPAAIPTARRSARPLLVRGAVRAWPAFERWTFDYLAAACAGQSAKVHGGLTEQGDTLPSSVEPVSPYLAELGAAEQRPASVASLIRADDAEPFSLDWSRMGFTPAKYLAQWDLLESVPSLRSDVDARALWPRGVVPFAYAFVGPANTLTGLHWDLSNNWFCQVRGTKEVLLFPNDQAEHLGIADKYDAGAVLAKLDLSRLDADPAGRERFAGARGWYARVDAGDALYIPRGAWHSVIAQTPSVSVGIFGLTPLEVVWRGASVLTKEWLHQRGWYATRGCTCHPAGTF